MKIEIGESLFYSWLRHIMNCQIVQTNWKVSPQWEIHSENQIISIMRLVDEYFKNKFDYEIFKNNSSPLQVLKQGECDVLGVSYKNEVCKYYAVDVAFHTNGLNYGEKNKTVAKVIEKIVRTSMCLYGYFNDKNAKIIFASPKINRAILNDLNNCIDDLDRILRCNGFYFEISIIANEDFNTNVLQPVLQLSDEIADTSELFLRSHQMVKMFENNTSKQRTEVYSKKRSYLNENAVYDCVYDEYKNLKIGEIVRGTFRRMLEQHRASESEIALMQTSEYSKEIFHIKYPLLVRTDSNFNNRKYYSDSIVVYGAEYRICNDWFEKEPNNDRPYLLKWIAKHKDEEE